MYIVRGLDMARQDYAGLSFEQTVQKYAQNVYAACVVRLNGNADVDDCVQNTFVKLYQTAIEFRDTEHLKAWLLRVAINECRQSTRRSRRHVPLDTARKYPLPPADDRHDLSWALSRLSPKYREVLYLHYLEGYKVDEIASILDVKVGTVKSLLHRGRLLLKAEIGGDGE